MVRAASKETQYCILYLSLFARASPIVYPRLPTQDKMLDEDATKRGWFLGRKACMQKIAKLQIPVV